MELTRDDAYAFRYVLETAKFDPPIKTIFRYVLSKNIKTCKTEIETTDALFQLPEEYNQYITERVSVYRNFNIGIYNDGRLNQEDLRKLEPEKYSEMTAQISAIEERNKELVETVRKINEEKTKFAQEKIDLPLETIKLDDIPNISDGQENHWEIWRLLEMIAVK